MHILFYHWVPFYEYYKEGGGIAVYMNNLIRHLCEHTDHRIACLCSGYKKHPTIKKAFLQRTNNPCASKGCETWEIINSPIIAPCVFHAFNPAIAYTDNETTDLFVDFVRQQGGFDVIHFHSLEGIAPQVLEKLKKNFPETKLFFSVHDYHAICPGIRLFQQKHGINCTENCQGTTCLDCTPVPPYKTYYTHLSRYINDRYNKPILRWFYRKILRHGFIKKNWQSVQINQQKAEDYLEYRKTFVRYINSYTDGILPVSERTKQIMVKHGIRPELMQTAYIGTKAADQALNHQAHAPNKKLTILFMGYASATEKGFAFLLNALKTLPKAAAEKLNFVIAAGHTEQFNLKEALGRLANYKLFDGYTHDQLPEIMQSVDLGIVPVLWEDNLPQVAIEMVAHGVPILCSDMGGASELCDCEDFKFKAGDEADLIQKLTNFVEKPELLYRYWEHHRGLTTMQQHVEQLESIYQQKTS